VARWLYWDIRRGLKSEEQAEANYKNALAVMLIKNYQAKLPEKKKEETVE